MNPEEAYKQLLDLHGETLLIASEMKSQLKYSPFEYLPGKLLGEIREIRASLIKERVEHFRQLYTPNLQPQEDFQKLMTEWRGELGFQEDLIEEWFKNQTHDPQRLSVKSLEQLVHAARHLVPYRSQGGEWGYERDWHMLIDKLNPRVLVLRCYSWTGGRYVSGIHYAVNSEGQLNALESLVDVVTMPGHDPATVKPEPWITAHVQQTHQDPMKFYGRHAANHVTVEAFQFFKNEKLVVWFKTARDAQSVAQVLTTGALDPVQVAAPVQVH